MIDRGQKKWVSIMIPQHREMLHQLENEQYNVAKPVLSEDKLDEIQYVVEQSVSNEAAVEILYHKNQRQHKTNGYIRRYDQLNQTLMIESGERIERIYITDIIDCYLL